MSNESNKLACLHASITRRRISESCDGFPMCALIAAWIASISDSISNSLWKNSLTKMRRAITEQCTTMSCSNFRPAGPETIKPFSPLNTIPPPGKSAPLVIRPMICIKSFS